MERWMNIQQLGPFLRWMGTLLLLGAYASFMLEGWQEFGSQFRYLLFLGFVLGLAALGILIGWRVREDKGARTLLGLAIAGIAAQFSQLGAMIHSIVSIEDGTLPDAFLHSVDGWASLLGNTAAISLLMPVAYLGFSALNRPYAKQLTVTYLSACVMLLIPVRHDLPLAVLLMALAAVTLWCDSRFMTGTPSGNTGEGIVSRALLNLPLAIMIVRAAFYPQSSLFIGLTTASVGLLCFELLPRFIRNDAATARIQAMTVLPIIVGWHEIMFRHLPSIFAAQPPLLTWLPLSLLLVGLSLRTTHGTNIYRKAAAAFAAAGIISQLTGQPGLLSAFSCLTLSIALIIGGFYSHERVAFTVGLVGTIFSLAYYIRFAADLYSYGPWGLLAVIGLLVLISSSYMEKHAARVWGRLVLLREEIKGWN